MNGDNSIIVRTISGARNLSYMTYKSKRCALKFMYLIVKISFRWLSGCTVINDCHYYYYFKSWLAGVLCCAVLCHVLVEKSASS